LGTLDDCTTYRTTDNISAIAHSCIREEGYERGNRKEEARFDDNPDNFLQIAPVLLIGPNTVNMMHLVPFSTRQMRHTRRPPKWSQYRVMSELRRKPHQ